MLFSLKDATIGVIGGGVVGKATARSYLEFAKEVRVYDVVKEKSTHTIYQVLDTDIIFICLPTPQKLGGIGCDTSILSQFLSDIAGSKKLLVVKSTVPIGTTNQMANMYGLPNLVHSPEFLTARCSLQDANLPSRNIIGVPQDVKDAQLYLVLVELYKQRFSENTPTIICSSDESEALKLITNSFFAVKVAFFNEIEELCSRLSLSYDTIINMLLTDGRVLKNHTIVPGPDGKRGFGGECLPKDICNLLNIMFKLGLQGDMCLAAINRNYRDRERS